MKPYYSQDGVIIYHGDCRDVLPLFVPVHLVLTDPPYGIALKEHGRNGYDWTIRGDEDQSLGSDVLARLNHLPVIAFASPQKPWPGTWRQHLVWDKGPTVGGGGDSATCWKFSWDLIQVARTGRLNGKRDQAVLTYWVTQQDYALHPNQKPLPLLTYLIEKTTDVGGVVLDPFAGSGSTLVAAKQCGRQAIGIEAEEGYCEIAANRLRQGVLFGQEVA